MTNDAILTVLYVVLALVVLGVMGVQVSLVNQLRDARLEVTKNKGRLDSLEESRAAANKAARLRG